MQTRYHTLTVAPADRTDYWRAAMALSLIHISEPTRPY